MIIAKRTAQSMNVAEVVFSILSRANFRSEQEAGFDGELLVNYRSLIGRGEEKILHFRIVCPAHPGERPRVNFSKDGSFWDRVDTENQPGLAELMLVTCEAPDA